MTNYGMATFGDNNDSYDNSGDNNDSNDNSGDKDIIISFLYLIHFLSSERYGRRGDIIRRHTAILLE